MTAGEIADEFNVAKSTMSAHFAVLREAGLIAAEKQGTTITYTLRLSVLQDALLGFADAFGVGTAPTMAKAASPRKTRHAT
jgi:DNA-binding transcriptional ArsR family regulator